MNKVTVNGRTYTAPDGCSISVIGNKAYANGKLLEDFNESKEKNIEINIEGNCGDIKCDCGNITVKGNSGNVTSDTGNIKVNGDINGYAKTDCGNIHAKTILGNAKTDVGNVNGKVMIDNWMNNDNKSYNYKVKSKTSKWFSEMFEDIFN